MFGNNSCCSDQKEIVIDSDKPISEKPLDEKGCCEGPNCECLCCGVLFVFQESNTSSSINSQRHLSKDFFYRGNYTFNNSLNIWHPPKLSI